MKKFELIIKSVCEYLLDLGYVPEDIKAMSYEYMVKLISGKIEFTMFNREENWDNHKARITDYVVSERVAVIEDGVVPAAEPVVEADPAVQSNKSNGGVVMNKQLMNTIVTMAINSQYGSAADYALYKALNVKPAAVKDDLNALYKLGYIKVKQVRNFKTIMPTSKAYKEFQDARPVSKEACKLVFKYIAEYEAANKKYWNVSYDVLARVCERRVGAVTFDNVLAKLEKAGYIAVRRVGATYTVISTTGTGNRAFAKVQ